MFIQSILVIIATLCAAFAAYTSLSSGFSLLGFGEIFSLLTCISLLVYSFYGFNKDPEEYFTSAVIFYIIYIFLSIWALLFVLNTFTGYLNLVQFILLVYFLIAFKKNYRGANLAMLGVVLISTIVVIINYLSVAPWLFLVFKSIVIPWSIALTYFERVQRGKYPKISI